VKSFWEIIRNLSHTSHVATVQINEWESFTLVRYVQAAPRRVYPSFIYTHDYFDKLK